MQLSSSFFLTDVIAMHREPQNRNKMACMAGKRLLACV